MIEDVGKVGVEAVDALKAQPALLALIMLNCIVFGATYFALQHRDQRAHDEFISVIERCFPLDREKE